jgi:hypothetical protein
VHGRRTGSGHYSKVESSRSPKTAAALAPDRRASRKRGHTFSEPDVLIAAAAEVEALIVVSRDVRDFTEARVPVLDPWTAAFWAPGQPETTLADLDRGDLLERIGESG